MTVIRAFIAVDLSAEAQRRLQQVSQQLRRSPGAAAVRWVAPENIHLTLMFLGDVSPNNLSLLQQALLSDAQVHNRFEFSLGGLGAFPSLARPRVVWLGVQASPELAALQSAIQHSMERLGYQSEERDFSPHLTLGRVSRSAVPQDVRSLSETLQQSISQEGMRRDLATGTIAVQQVNLYRSDLRPEGPIYTILFSAPLPEKAGSHSL